MLKFGLACLRFQMSKIQSSLKILELTPPTTKKEIRSKYFQMAKQLHPDLNVQGNKKKSKQQQKQLNEAFIKITQAYKYLYDLSENQINNPKEDSNDNLEDSKNDATGKQTSDDYFRPMTNQQKMRKSTYAYFNRRYRKQQSQEQSQKIPLYKQIPQFFVGCLFVFAFICEWAYTSFRRSKNGIKQTKKEEFLQTFQGLNFKKRYQQNLNRHQ